MDSGRSQVKMGMVERNCPVCGNSEHKFLFRDYNRRDNIGYFGTYVQCRECSLVYLLDRPRWNEIVKFYSLLQADITTNTGQANAAELRQQTQRSVPKWKQFLRKVRFRPHSWPLEPVPADSKRLLDVGCGNGSKLFEFAQRGYEVWGVDVSADAIHLCREILPQGHFIQGELQEAGLSDAHFDYIRIDNTLEHVPNPREVIGDCNRLLKKGGQLLVYVPHGRSFSLRLMKGNSISAWIPFHLQLFTQQSLHRLLMEAGFEDVYLYGYCPTSWLPMSIIQWKSKKKAILKFSYPPWLNLASYPIGWLSIKIKMAEELFAVCIKR